MKRLVLLLALFLCFTAGAQKMNRKFLEGTWETEFHNVEFKGTNKKDFTISITLKETGEKINVVRYAFDKNNLYLETYYEPNDWKSIGKLIIVDGNTMVEDVISDAPGILVYKRKL